MTLKPLSSAAQMFALADIREHLRLTDGADDALLPALAEAATDHLERALGLSLIDRAFRLTLDAWPDTGEIALPIFPVTAINAFALVAFDGSHTAIIPRHILIGSERPARLIVFDPPEPYEARQGIAIDLVAGFGPAGSDVPASLRRALLLHIAFLHAEAGAGAGADPADCVPGWSRLVAPFAERRL